MRRLSSQLRVGAIAFLLMSQLPVAADSQGQVIIQPNTPLVSRSRQVQLFSGTLKIQQDQVALPLTLRVTNGSWAGSKFAWVRVFLNKGAVRTDSGPVGHLICDERRLAQSNPAEIDLTGQLSVGTNTLIIQGAGMPGAGVSYELVSTGSATAGGAGGSGAKPGAKLPLKLTSLDPADIAPDSVFTIKGQGFDEVAANNKVSLYSTTAQVQKASKTELEVKAPSNLPPHAMAIDVTVNGVKSNSLQITIMGPPELSGLSPDILQPGSASTLSGNNFSKIPSKNVVSIYLPVYDLKKSCTVTASSEHSITFTAPDFMEASDRINKAVGATGNLSLTVNGVPAKNTLSVQARASSQ